SSRRRHTRFSRDWSSDVCSSDLGDRTAGLDRIREAWAEQAQRLERLGRPDAAEGARRRAALHGDRLSRGELFDGMAQYLAFFYPELGTLLDYVGQGLVILDEPDHGKDRTRVV